MIYLDNAATTKPLFQAIEYAKIYNEEDFYNPSALYSFGLKNHKEIEKASQVLANSISNGKHDVIFTSCGTESNNQAIFGMVKRGVAVSTLGEHSAVYKPFLELKNRGFKVCFASLNSDGSVNEEDFINLCSQENVSFVSVVHVNNETGAINDINKLAKIVKSINKRIIFHSDGVQAFGKLPYKLSEDIDLYSISAHKINALKGTGALFIKKGLTIPPLLFGGGQSNGLRSGTENIFGIKVLEYATSEKYSKITENFEYVKNLKNSFISNLNHELFTIISSDNSSPYIISLSANGVKGEVVLHMLEKDGIIIGNGSACSSKNRFSRVIEACGYKNNDGIIRVSFSPYNTVDEVIYAAKKINEQTEKLQRIMKK